MTITLTPEIENTLTERARQKRIAPEEYALSLLQETLAGPTDYETRSPEERNQVFDDWLREARPESAETIPAEALRREAMYADDAA